jgi:hypothetical protein
MKYLHFVKLNGTTNVYPRAHLRWMELVDDETLHLGFSSETVIILGRNLGCLVADIACARRKTITQTEERHLSKPESEFWVKAILSQPHTHSK